MNPRFGRVITAMITPFNSDGSLDVQGACDLAQWLAKQGNNALVLAGTTGESPTITQDEQIQLVEAVAQAVDIPVIAGAGSNDTRSAITNTQRCEQAGAKGILSVTPYYNRPSQAGLYEHYLRISDSTELPIMLYDIPIRTGRKLESETMLRLAEETENIVAVKDAAGDIEATAELVAQAPDGFEVYSGEDALTLQLLAVGAVGTVSVASHWTTPETVSLMESFFSGDLDKAKQINQQLIPSYDFESGDLNPNPIPTKAMMKVLGLPGGDCRLPMGPEPEGLQEKARDILEGLGRL